MVKAAIFGVIPAGVLMIAVGAILTIAFKSTDISSLFMKIGSPVVGGLALILGTWKVNVVNAYSGGCSGKHFQHPGEVSQVDAVLGGRRRHDFVDSGDFKLF